MKVVQYISGKFHYTKYVKFLVNKIDFKFVYSGKPNDKFISNEVNCWFFYTLLQVLIKLLPSRFFSFSLRISYFFWEISVRREIKKDFDVNIYHFLCHGFTGQVLKKYKNNKTILLGHVVNAHPKVQSKLIEKSISDAGMFFFEDNSRTFVDDNILKEVILSDYVISPSKFVTDTYVECGFSRDKFITLNYGLERELLVKDIVSTHVHEKGQPIKIISVGQIIPRKGQFLLVSILDELTKEGYLFELVLVGHGDANYLNAIYSIGYSFKHINHMKNNDLQDYMKSFDLFVLPSYEDGFAVAVTEAISANLPVIVSSAVGAADLFVNKSSSVFDVGSKESLKNRVKNFINGNYSESFDGAYDWDEYSIRLVDCYKKVSS